MPVSPDHGLDRPADRSSIVAVRIARTAAVYLFLLSLFVNALMFRGVFLEEFITDHAVFWTVGDMIWNGRLAEIYDAAAVTAAHPFRVDPGWGFRPWVYPPTALPFVTVLSIPSLWVSFTIWLAVSLIVYVVVVYRAWPSLQPHLVVLAAASWPVLNALSTGQVSPILGAGIIAALATLDRRPVFAGILLAVAGVFKPSYLILLPIALVAGRYWITILSGAFTTAFLVAATTIIYGVDLWTEWLNSIDGFFDLVVAQNYHVQMITPKALAAMYDMPESAGTLLQVVGAASAAVLCWTIFRRSNALAARLVALVGGSFLTVPYAMHYDLAILVPIAAYIVLRTQNLSDLHLIFPAFMLCFPLLNVAAVVTMIALTWLLFDTALRRSSILNDDERALSG